jgi:hypothetical protein
MAAERMYQHAIRIDPGHQPAYEGLAHLLHRQGRSNEAQQLLTAWSETQPYVADSGMALSRLQQEQGDWVGAEQSLRQALSANPRHPEGPRELARLQRRLGRRGAALLSPSATMSGPYQPTTPAEWSSLQQHSGGSPALLMAQQMPVYDPTFQGTVVPGVAPAPVGPAPYGAGSLAGGATIYPQLNQQLASRQMQAPPLQWGTPAAVELPSAVGSQTPGAALTPTFANYDMPATMGPAPGTMGPGSVAGYAAYGFSAGPAPMPTSVSAGFAPNSGGFFQAMPATTAGFDGGSAPIWNSPTGSPSMPTATPAGWPAGAIPASPISMPSVGAFGPQSGADAFGGQPMIGAFVPQSSMGSFAVPAPYGPAASTMAPGPTPIGASPAAVLSGVPAVQAF